MVGYEKEEILDLFPEETNYLRDIYRNVKPDQETMKSQPMIVDLFGYVHELKSFQSGDVYFQDVGQFGATIKCITCKTATHHEARKTFVIKTEPTDYLSYQYQHQCQHCGTLKFAEVNDKENLLETKCECRGYFRRDKPLLCPECTNTGEIIALGGRNAKI